jgi:uncharacterized repeat protein (TIGR03803 family)
VTSFEEHFTPVAGVIQASDGRLYGTTHTDLIPAGGTLFAIEPSGALVTLLYFSFPAGGRPVGGLFEGIDGSLYGATYLPLDGGVPPGMIFKITGAGELIRIRQMYQLQSVIQASDGTLYGTTSSWQFCTPTSPSCPYIPASVFKIDSAGTLTTLHSFGDSPFARKYIAITLTSDGSLYGVTFGRPGYSPDNPIGYIPGTVFRIDPTGTFTTLHTFNGADGDFPRGRLIQVSDGGFYGTTSVGGAFGYGTVFRFDPAGGLTTLHHFDGSDGANPLAGLVQGSDGRFFGTTANGGAFGYGTIFVIDAEGALTTLHSFALTDGAHPDADLIQARDGAFYGTAPMGGPTSGGVIFRVRLATSTPDQYFELVSRNSGKCLDVYGASTDAVAPIIQWACHGGPNQLWRLDPVSDGAVRIIAHHSGQVLDVYGGLVDDVTPVIQYPWHGGDNQRWTVEPASNGFMFIVARHSGKVLDVESGSMDDGARVIQYTGHGGANQQWLLRAVAPAADPVTTLSDREP